MDVDAFWQMLNDTQFFGMNLADVIGKGIFVVAVCLIALLLQRVLVRIARKVLEAAEVPSASILVNILKALIWSLALIAILEPVFGIKPTAFLAALGIGSVALSLGLQDTVSNLIGGLTLMLTQVIELGDVIKVGDFTGTVVDINWRSTSLRDSYGQVNVIPNSVLSKTALVKLSAYTISRCQISMVIKHGSDINDVKADIESVAKEVLGKKIAPAMGVNLLVEGFDAAGIQAKANVHLVRGADFDEARTILVGRLVDRPWVVRVA